MEHDSFSILQFNGYKNCFTETGHDLIAGGLVVFDEVMPCYLTRKKKVTLLTLSKMRI